MREAYKTLLYYFIALSASCTYHHRTNKSGSWITNASNSISKIYSYICVIKKDIRDELKQDKGSYIICEVSIEWCKVSI